jgi:hypothetical protein
LQEEFEAKMSARMLAEPFYSNLSKSPEILEDVLMQKYDDLLS